VQIMDGALAEAARRAGSGWCAGQVAPLLPWGFRHRPLDALRLSAAWKRCAGGTLEGGGGRRAGADVDCRAWADFPGDRETGILGETVAERERFEEFANEAACPALDPATGRCDVYAWRPMTCRFLARRCGWRRSALAHCELCFAARGGPRSPPARCRFRTIWRRGWWRKSAMRVRRWWRLRCCATCGGANLSR